MRKIITTAVIAFLSISLLSACNTIRGFGKDVKQGGQVIEGSTTNHHHY